MSVSILIEKSAARQQVSHLPSVAGFQAADRATWWVRQESDRRSPAGRRSFLPDSLPSPRRRMPRTHRGGPRVGQSSTEELLIQSVDDPAEPSPGCRRQSAERVFEGVPSVRRITAGAVVPRQIQVPAGLVQEALVLVQSLSDSTAPQVLGLDPVDGCTRSAGNAWNLTDGTSRAAGWPPLSTDGTRRPTRHGPFGSASWCTSCQGPGTSSSAWPARALDVHTHSLCGFRLTPVSDTSS
ncbi:MAG: hypothetical protein JWR24_5663 [Actinoallomurus sp.]|nr:hypothetical protein [Actinoallomurus sp.]